MCPWGFQLLRDRTPNHIPCMAQASYALPEPQPHTQTSWRAQEFRVLLSSVCSLWWPQSSGERGAVCGCAQCQLPACAKQPFLAIPVAWPSLAVALCRDRALLPCRPQPLTVLSFPADSSTKQTLQVPGSRAAAPRPPVPANNSRPQDDADSSRGSPPELPRTQRPSLPDLSRPGAAGGTGMKHSSSAPPPPPPGRRAAAPPAPPPAHAKASPYNREKPLPPTPGQRPPGSRDGPPAPPPIKPPPSPGSLRSGAQGQSLAPPPPPYRQPPGVPNGPSSPSSESAPELPQRHNSLHRKAPGPLRGLAPPPPTAASPNLQSSRPPPPARDPPSRGAGKGHSLHGAWGQLG